MNIAYLILGLIATFIIPLGLLKLAIFLSDSQNKNHKY